MMVQAAQIEVEVTGIGITEDAAIEQGLIRAVRQVNGTDIDTVSKSQQAQIRNDGKTHIKLETRQGLELKARGQIASYDVLSTQCDEADCEVQLAVRVYKYKESGMASTNRRKLAVVPFTGGSSYFNKQLTAQLEEQLVQSRRFAMLDRSGRQALKKEKALWRSDKTPVSEKAKLGQMLGLDYMLFGTVTESRVKRWTKKLPLTGEEKKYAETIATVRYEMVSVATGQVKWVNTVTDRKVGAVLDKTANAVARQISSELLANIFPLRVVGLTTGQVVLNQGGSTLNIGDRLNIFAVGEKMIDPYNREVLGQTETEIAMVKVVRVTAKTTYAEVISGNLSSIKVMQIARAVADNKKKVRTAHSVKKPAVKSDTEIAEGGGVIL